jgi:hypothetical protein
VKDGVDGMIKYVANEPSVGLYFVQQHARASMPILLDVKVPPPGLPLPLPSVPCLIISSAKDDTFVHAELCFGDCRSCCFIAGDSAFGVAFTLSNGRN